MSWAAATFAATSLLGDTLAERFHGQLRRCATASWWRCWASKDLIVVDTPDALLIADRSRAQEVGDLVKLLERERRDALL